MLHPVLATMLLHLQRLCTLPELSWREDKEDNWGALLQGDLQRRYDTRVGRTLFSNRLRFLPFDFLRFCFNFLFLTHSVLLSP